MSGFWRDFWRSFTHPVLDPYAPGDIPIEDMAPPPEDWMVPWDEEDEEALRGRKEA
jgi:hypothetical protein